MSKNGLGSVGPDVDQDIGIWLSGEEVLDRPSVAQVGGDACHVRAANFSPHPLHAGRHAAVGTSIQNDART